MRIALLGLVALVVAGSAAHAQADVIRGHVRSEAGPIAGATVTAANRDRAIVSVTADSAGAYSLSFPAQSGPYSLIVGALGFARQTRAVADGSQNQDFMLVAAVQRLAAVEARAQRPRVARDQGGAGAGEAGTNANVSNGVSGDITGDLIAAMSTVPGITVTPDPAGGLPTVSAFGLSADQNGLTLNGMNFSAGSIPRDGLALRVSSSTYDPGRGGFSGVQTSLRLQSGTNFVNQFVHFTGEDRSLQGSVPNALSVGNLYSRQIVSGSWSGPIKEDKAYYATSFQFTHRTSDLSTLNSLRSTALNALGVSADSVTRLMNISTPLGIPLATGAVPSDRLSTNVSILSRFDYAPNATNRLGNVFYVLAGGNYSDNLGTRNTPLALASHGGDTRNWAGNFQMTSSRFLGSLLNEANVSFASTASQTTPYLPIPDARILVGSSLPGGGSGSATLRAGGNSNAESESTSWSAQARNDLSWFSWNSKHQFKVTVDGRVDDDVTTQSSNRFGTYSFNSLTDLANNQPASFSRVLGSRESTARQYIGALGLGSTYRPIRDLRVQYGLRFERSQFSGGAPLNSSVDALFSRQTSKTPSAFTVAPMVGFTRQYRTHGGGNFTGGVREYISNFSLQSVENVSRQTGLPSSVGQITCVGSATPVPAWSTYINPLSIPTACANGSSLAQSGSPVTVFAPGYSPSRRWGAALTWNARFWERWSSTVTTNYSLNRNRPGSFDLNFDATQRFTLNAEAGRPVFVPATSVVPATGAVSSTASRLTTQFASVNELRSDLNSDARQLILGITRGNNNTPSGFRFATTFRAFYTYSSANEQQRGFGGGNTAGDPRLASQATSGLPTHTVQLFGRVEIPKWFAVDAFSRFASGRRYTPMVAGDINGDGQSNDRAFVFNPATVSDPAVASSVNALLANKDSKISACLKSQIGRVASRNSCYSPWTQSLNLAITPDVGRFRDRAQVSLVVHNVFGAMDQMLHGPSRLHNWGTAASPDATLLNVRGFDAATNRFKYDVNPLFGSSVASQTVARVPFVIALDVQLRLGPDRDAQMLKGFLKPRPADRTSVLDEAQIRERLEHDAQNFFSDIAERKNAVSLSPDQVAQLGRMAKRFDAVRDSVYDKLAKYLASLNGRYLTVEARKTFHDAFVKIARTYVTFGPAMHQVLSDEQFTALPAELTAYFDMDVPTFDRIMANTNFSALLELIAGEGPN